MTKPSFIERAEVVYKEIEEVASAKLVITKHKGDWLDRGDKTKERVISGLVIEVGELIKSLEKGDEDEVLSECGDILNYLVIIYEKFSLNKNQGRLNAKFRS